MLESIQVKVCPSEAKETQKGTVDYKSIKARSQKEQKFITVLRQRPGKYDYWLLGNFKLRISGYNI